MAEQNGGGATGFFGSQGNTGANSRRPSCQGTSWSALVGFSVSLQPGSVFGAVVSQKPSRVICQRGTSVTIQCEADSQLTYMFWYRQLPGQSLTLIATANQGSDATYESGFKKDKFPISRPNLTFSILTVSSAGPEDSSFYFCSVGDTVLGRDQRSEQEPQRPPPCSLLPLPSSPAPIQRSLDTQAGGRKPQLWGRDSRWCVWWVGMSVNGRTGREENSED